MAYYIDLFSPDTYEAFMNSDRNVSGSRQRQESIAAKLRPGYKLICYVTRLSRWVGVLEVTSKYFINDTPIFVPANDPFVVRFQVDSLAYLHLEQSIPIEADICWKSLTFTKQLPKKSLA